MFVVLKLSHVKLAYRRIHKTYPVGAAAVTVLCKTAKHDYMMARVPMSIVQQWKSFVVVESQAAS